MDIGYPLAILLNIHPNSKLEPSNIKFKLFFSNISQYCSQFKFQIIDFKALKAENPS
jgi:hypothetical protein